MIWLFDIDGTLIRCGGAGSAAMASAMVAAFGVPGETSGIPFSGRTDFAITKDLFEKYEIPFTPECIQVFYAAYLQRLPETLAEKQGEIMPGAVRWLERLAEHPQCGLGLVTGNMRRAARIKMEFFGLWHYFADGGYGDSEMHRSAVVSDAISAMQVHAEQEVQQHEIWAVGDTPLDIQAARSHGINVVGVATGGHQKEELADHNPDHLVSSLVDDSLLDQIV